MMLRSEKTRLAFFFKSGSRNTILQRDDVKTTVFILTRRFQFHIKATIYCRQFNQIIHNFLNLVKLSIYPLKNKTYQSSQRNLLTLMIFKRRGNTFCSRSL